MKSNAIGWITLAVSGASLFILVKFAIAAKRLEAEVMAVKKDPLRSLLG